MGRDKGPSKGKGAAAAAAAGPEADAAVQLSLRPDECPLCGHDVAVSEEQHILGTCGACGGHPYHVCCVQEHLEKVLRPMIREGGFGTKAWEKVQQKVKVRPCDMFATNGTSQRLPVNCPACKSGVMLAADMVKPVRKLTPAPPVPPPKQPRSQQPAPSPAPKKGPATPAPSGAALARQQAATARASLGGSSLGNRSGAGLARAGSASSSSAGGGLASGATRPDPIPSRPAWLRLCNSVLEDARCYVYNCPFCHSEEEQQEREAEYLEKQKEAARRRRAAELEQHRREEEQQRGQQQRERQAQQQAEQAGEESEFGLVGMVRWALAASADLQQADVVRQAEVRRQALAREEATLPLCEDALALMKRHKHTQCIASLTEMGYSADQAAAAADAAGCEPAAAASLLVDGGLSGAGSTAVGIVREAQELLAEGTKLGLSPAAVEAALVAAGGDWEQARWELQQVCRAAQVPSKTGSTASSAEVVSPAASPAQLCRQGSTASSGAAAVSSRLLGSSWAGVALAPAAAAALPAGSAASSSSALNEWGSQDPHLASATSAWRHPVQPSAAPAGGGSDPGYDDGFAAGMAAALRGLEQPPGASAVAAAPAVDQLPSAAATFEAAAEPGADAEARGWVGGVPPPRERPPASDAEVDFLMSLMC